MAAVEDAFPKAGGGADDGLAERVRQLIAGPGVGEKRMFGGICFLIDGNMAVGASLKRGLLLRVGKDGYGAALLRPGTRPMEMRGRPVEGYLYVDPAGLDDAAFAGWIAEAVGHVRTLPPKVEKPARRRAKRKDA